MGQSNSEHSRHWFFGGRMVLDGKEMPRSLFKIVKETLKGPLVADNSVSAPRDNPYLPISPEISPISPYGFLSSHEAIAFHAHSSPPCLPRR